MAAGFLRKILEIIIPAIILINDTNKKILTTMTLIQDSGTTATDGNRSAKHNMMVSNENDLKGSGVSSLRV